MKRIFKYLTVASLSGMLCLFLAFPANAQRGGHGGGGGGFHGGGGGGFHGGGGGGFRGGGGFSGGGRVTATPQRSTSARSYSSASANRGRVAVSSRGYTSGRNAVSSRGYTSGRVAVGGRGYTSGRVAVGGYGRGYGAFGRGGGYFYNRGFYGSLYYPRLGFSLGYLPYGYYPFWWGDDQFYYSNGFYYNYDAGQYTVVEPPVGAAINTLPTNAQPITINGTQYYELNGVYYQPITKDDGSVAYQIAGKDGQLNTDNGGGQVMGDQGNGDQGTVNAPDTHPNPRIGDMIQQLPQDSRRVRINGQTLYVTPDDVYLKQTTDSNGNKTYSVVGLPNSGPQD